MGSDFGSELRTLLRTTCYDNGCDLSVLYEKWNVSLVDICFSILKVTGVVFGVLYCLKVGPAWFFAPDVGPFLYEKLVISVSLLVPIGSAF